MRTQFDQQITDKYFKALEREYQATKRPILFLPKVFASVSTKRKKPSN